ncbi:hypothetical protein VKT23_015117 [Stygiomarasmius scandens]|uniref:Fungal-type protein kinase domain-containing protein n=1 Tax=Marasmiellus scandens TaxID=2682957 RepID=A0ABR1J1X9_9AGAR
MLQLSIDDDNARLWYFSRSHSARSAPFNVKTDVRPLIRFIIAMLFGTPEQLGFDPSITRKRDDQGQIYYVYTINEHFYRTLAPLSDFCALAISGPSRWAQKHVLKDYWWEENHTELEIQRSIFQRLDDLKESLNAASEAASKSPPASGSLRSAAPESLMFVAAASDSLTSVAAPRSLTSASKPSGSTPKSPPLLPANYQRYFVTIIDQEVLNQTVPNICSKWQPSHLDDGQHVKQALGSNRIGHDGQLKVSTAPEFRNDQKFAPKQHCRILYQEVCETIDYLDDVVKIAQTLYDCVIELHLLYLVGYIHRDISVGNVFYDCSGGHGRISDLEYARTFHRDDAATDPKTGTLAFMALEIQSGVYYFWNYLITGDLFHNYIHDLESVFWLAVWMFSSTYMRQPPDIEKHKTSIDSMFGLKALSNRLKVMKYADGFSNIHELVQHTLSPAGIDALSSFHNHRFF